MNEVDRWHDRAGLGLMANRLARGEDISEMNPFFDFRPCSEEQLSMLSAGAQQRGPLGIQEMLAMMNYQWPEPEVPQGWADWYAHGKELH